MSIRNTIKRSLAVIPLAGIILFSSVGANAALGDTLLRQGARNADVQVLQNKLKELNFLTINNTTTYYGSMTVNAVKSFQRSKGLSADGIFGPASFKAIQGSSSSSSSTPVASGRTLRINMSGADVKNLQTQLKTLGHLKGNVDSKFGPQTKSSVVGFQQTYGLSADGIAGKNTFSTINKALNGSIPVKKPVSRGESTSSNNSGIIGTAKKYLGTPYVFGGNSTSGIDCSGFTQLVYKAHGVSIPRTTTGQAKAGSHLNRNQLRTGDLIIFSGTYRAGPSHAGIYISDGNFIHASSSKGVTISSLNSNYYSTHFSYGRRVY